MANSMAVGYDRSSGSPLVLSGFSTTSQGFEAFAGTLVSSGEISATEAQNSPPFPAGTLSNMWVRVASNGTSTGSPFTLRIAATNKTQTFTVGAAATGIVQDSTHSDSVTSNQQVDCAITPSGLSLVISALGATFSATTNTSTVCSSCSVPVGGSPTTGTSYYTNITGVVEFNTAEYNSSEAVVKCRFQKTFTASGLFTTLTASSNAATLTSRNAGAGGAQTLTYGTGVTGLVQDTTHTDSISTNTDYDTTYSFTTLSAGSWNLVGTYLTSSSGDSNYAVMSAAQASFTASSVTYYGLAGGLEKGDTTELSAECPINTAYTFSNIVISVISPNNNTGTSNLRLRANGTTNAGPNAAVGPSISGIVLDSSNTYAAASTDLCNYSFTAGSSGTITIWHMGINANTSAGGGPGIPNFLDWAPLKMIVDTT